MPQQPSPHERRAARTRLHQELAALGLKPDDAVLIHSSLRAMGPYPGGADALLETLAAYFAPGMLLLPAHSWATVYHGQTHFDQAQTPSCVGILAERFRHYPGVYRSSHPTHSLSGLGADADLYLAGDHHFDSPCAPRSPYGRLPEVEAQILMLGCDLRRCTTIHGIEEIADIPGRLTETRIEMTVRHADGRTTRQPMRYHAGSPSEQYHLLEPGLRERGIMREGPLFNAHCMVLPTPAFFDYTLERLRETPRLFDEPEKT